MYGVSVSRVTFPLHQHHNIAPKKLGKSDFVHGAIIV
jgi:hypothetical protein